jgi:hypothetical protein
MKKIKTIGQLCEEKNSLARRQHELEKDIAGRWHDIKDKTLHLQRNSKKEAEPPSALETIMAGALAFAGGILAKKIAHKISIYLAKHFKN